MNVVEKIIGWFTNTGLYELYLKKLPEPLDNPYLDLIVLAGIVLFLCVVIKDSISTLVFKIKLRKEEKILRDVKISRLKRKAMEEELEEENTCTIVFEVDNQEVSRMSYKKGEPITIPPTPIKKADIENIYEFKGWSPQITTLCVRDCTYTAVFKKIPREYTVAFHNEDGTILWCLTSKYGSKIKYKGPEPIKTPTEEDEKITTYKFIGWGTSEGTLIKLSDITTDMDLYAMFNINSKSNKEHEYVVEYYFDNVLDQTKTEKHKGLLNKAVTALDKYSSEEYKLHSAPETIIATQNTVVKAFYMKRSYNVKFYNNDVLAYENNYIKGEIPEYVGPIPTKNSTEKFSYKFIGWENKNTNQLCTTFSAIEEDTVYVAVFEETINFFTIRFLNADKMIHKEELVEYGAIPESPDEPQKNSDGEYKYEFEGWNPLVASATKDITYSPLYKRVKIDAATSNSKSVIMPTVTSVPADNVLDTPPKLVIDDDFFTNGTEKESSITSELDVIIENIAPPETNIPETTANDLDSCMNNLMRKKAERETISKLTEESNAIKEQNLRILEKKIDNSLKASSSADSSNTESTVFNDKEWEKRKNEAAKLAAKDKARKEKLLKKQKN